MRTVSVSEAKAHLGELVDEVASTRVEVSIISNGRPLATLIATDELEELKETLYWLSQPGIREDLAEAATGETIRSSELRDELGLNPIT